MLSCCFLVFAQIATVLSVPLDRLPVPTTVEGIPVTLYLSGTLRIDAGSATNVDADLNVDVGDLQRKFASIVRSRPSSAACEESLTLTAAALRWVDGRAEAAATATRETWECSKDARVRLLSSEQGAVKFRVDVRRSADDCVAFGIQATSVDGSKRLQELAARQLAGTAFASAAERALGASLSRQILSAPLPPDLRDLQPRVAAVEFKTSSSGDIVLHISAMLVVPAEKLPALLTWALGG